MSVRIVNFLEYVFRHFLKVTFIDKACFKVFYVVCESNSRRVTRERLKEKTQERFSNLTVVNTHKDRTYKLCFADVTSEFVDRNDSIKELRYVQRIRPIP